MKTLNRLFGCVALLAVAWVAGVSPAAAQATLNQTTLAARMTEGAAVAVVSSASTMAAGDVLYIDREAMTVRSVSGTNISVARGQLGTRATAHMTASVLYSGVPARFYNSDPPFGPCTAGNQLVLPYINVVSGGIYSCRNVGTINTAADTTTPAGTWGGTGTFRYAASIYPRRIVQDANYTAKPDDVVIALTSIGTTARTITLPSATGMAGKILIIQDESGQLSANVSSLWVVGTINQVAATSGTGGSMTTAYGVNRYRAGCGTPNGTTNSCSWFVW